MKTRFQYLLLALVLVIAAVPEASALLPTTSYNDASRIYTLNDWLGLDKVAEVQLVSNTDQCLIDCEAIIKITPDNADLSKEFVWKFYNEINNEKSIKDYKVTFLDRQTTYADVPDYKTTCNDESKPATCTDEIIGKHSEERIVESWKDISIIEKLEPQKEYYIKIEGKKNPYESVEWIPTIFGYELDRWAWWSSSWSKKQPVNINVTFANLNQTSTLVAVTYDSDMKADFGDIRFVDASETTEVGYWFYNNTCVASTSCNVWVKTDDLNSTANKTLYMYYGNAAATTTSNISTAFWFGDDFDSLDWTNKWQSTDHTLYTTLDGYLNLTGTGTTGKQLESNETFNSGYVTETRASSNTITGTPSLYYASISNARGTFYGKDYQNTVTTNDWQIDLNNVATNGGNPVASRYFRYNWAVNGSNNYAVANITDDSLVNDFSAQGATSKNTGFINFLPYNTAAENGKVDWIYVRRLVPSEPTYTFGAESTPLSIQLISPANGLNQSSSSMNFKCNVNESGSTGVLNVTLIINGVDNTTVTNTTANQNLSLSITKSLIDANYNWTCRGSLTTGSASAAVRIFAIDSASPTISIALPSGNYYLPPENISLNYSASDAGVGVGSCWYSLNGGTNVSIAGCVNTTFIISAFVSNSITLYANDSLNNVGSATNVFNAYPTFSICSPTINKTFLNFSFKDQITLKQLNATADSAAFSLSYGDTYSYTNLTKNLYYPFCAYPPHINENVNLTIKYSSSDGVTYPQITKSYTNMNLTNITTNKVLYLLSSSDGQYVTFQVINAALQPISGASIVINASVEGTNLVVGSSSTDASGGATFFLSPITSHVITISKTGYVTSSITLTPSSTSYTITLSAIGATNITDYASGLSYNILPTNYELNKSVGIYYFNLTISHTGYSFDKFGFRLINSSGSVVNSTSATTAVGGILKLSYNITDERTMTAKANWTIDGNFFEVTKAYAVSDLTGTEYSLAYLFNDLKIYTASGMFGLTSFGITLIVFIFIFVTTGIFCYNFGMYSPTAIAGIVFGQVALFDFLGLITKPAGAIVSFPTFFMGLILVALIVKEATSYN